MKVWITKAIDRACDTAVQLLEIGLTPVIVPMMEVTYLDPAVKYSDYDGIVIASSRSAIAVQLTPCFYEIGKIIDPRIKIIVIGNINTDQLLPWRTFADLGSLIEDRKNWPDMKLLYVRGTKKDAYISRRLNCDEAVLYRLTPLSLRPDQLLEISMTRYLLVYWRPAALKIIEGLQYIPSLFQKITPICINEQIAEVLRLAPWKNVIVADQPTENSMLQKLSSLLGR